MHANSLHRRAFFVAALICLLVSPAVGTAAASAASGPRALSLPSVSGPATQGATLTVRPGSWKGTGRITRAYRWYRCTTMGAHCRILEGVTGKRHRLGPNDVGHTLTVSVRVTDSGGRATAYTGLVGPVGGISLLASTVRPAVAGAAVLSTKLRVSPGRWTRTPDSFAYQWTRCNVSGRLCTPIDGATDDSYTVGTHDLGHILAAIVQARRGSTTQAVFSLATAPVIATDEPARSPAPATAPTPPPTPAKPVQPTGPGPASSSPPLVGILVQEGGRLTGTAGTWSGSGAVAYAYQWYRCDAAGAHCKSVHGATSTTYRLVAKDVGQTLGFAVRATDASGTVPAYASLVGPVAPRAAPLVSTAQPTISGTAAVGQTLQAGSGGWNAAPAALAYQWQRCNANGRLCVPIAGATAAAYTVAAADAGHALVARVHASIGDAAQDALSASRPVAAETGPKATAVPTVSGVVQEGKQLTGAQGTWAGQGTIAYAYQWFRCDPAGAHCKSIHGATRATYTLVAKDVGQTIGLTARATDQTGTGTAYASLVGPVAAAGAAVVSTVQPAITGSPTAGQTLQVSNGEWGNPPSSFAYQWQRCNPNGRLCVAVPGATGATYAVTAADAGHALVAAVQATAPGGAQAALSAAVRP